MRLSRRTLALLLLAGGTLLVAEARAAESPAVPKAWRVPPLAGEVSGEFRPLTVPGAPSLQWKVQTKSVGGGLRTAQITLDGPGTRLRGEVQVDVAGDGSWTVTTAEIDIATWSAAVAGFLGDEFKGASAQGALAFSGAGTLRNGVVGGHARFVLAQGRVDHPERKLLVEGIALTLDVPDIAARKSAPGQSLTWDGGNFESIPFGLGHVDFSLAGEQVQVEEASVEVFGGEVVLAAFSFSTVRREASVIARVIGIDVSHLLKFLPSALASARGLVDGSVALHRTPKGIQIGNGTLALRAGETADLRLLPTPGLLSASLPETVLKVYPGLGKIETGEVPIRAEQLEVAFTPGGDAQGRTAAIRVVGGPMDPRLRAPVDLNINVRGPLEQLIRFGTDSRLKFGGPAVK